MYMKNKSIYNILYGIFLILIILFHSYLNTQYKEGFTGVINDIYKDLTKTTNSVKNKTIRKVRQTFRNNKETFQRGYRSLTRPVNKL